MTARRRRVTRRFMPSAEHMAPLDDHEQRIRALEALGGIPMQPYRTISDGTDKHLINAGPTEYRGHFIANPSDDFVYVHLYNKASAPGDSDTPVVTLGIPFESGANQEYSEGVEGFDLGLAVAISSDAADSSGAVGAGACVAIIYWSEA